MVIVIGVTSSIADFILAIGDLMKTQINWDRQATIGNLKSTISKHKVLLHALAPGTYSRWSGHP